MEAQNIIAPATSETGVLCIHQLIARRLGHFGINDCLAGDMAAAVLSEFKKILPESALQALVKTDLMATLASDETIK